jgi:putative membrane protein insertion efficiency factor
MSSLGIAAVRFYQRYLRNMHNRACIYTPSCSEYTILCMRKFGLIRGVRYGYQRIQRCNGALYAGGDDWP